MNSEFKIKIHNTRLPSNLMTTTHEYIHLVMHGHFQSRDKDDKDKHYHTIQSIVAENPCYT